MPNYRLKSANINLRDELATIINQEFKFSALVTVIKIETSGDFKNIKAYLSVMPTEETQKVTKVLQKAVYEISRQLAQRVRIKYIPRIHFFYDQGGKNAVEVEKIIAKLHEEKKISKKAE
ncbi:MAG: 30S ribosome-binding factor RbfA [Patescibacteria group bacterium]|nr:30S ribosome-binding factor RbfA [Patescibacteria group bacterium]